MLFPELKKKTNKIMPSRRSSSGSRASARPRAIPKRAPPPAPIRRAAPPPAPTQKAAPPPTQPQPTPTVQSGGGMMPGLGSTIVGSMVGSAIGHTVGRRLNDAIDATAAEATPTAYDQSAVENYQSNESKNDICYFQSQDLINCLRESKNDTSTCQYFVDALKECRRQQQQQY
jgi:hypothetical protein